MIPRKSQCLATKTCDKLFLIGCLIRRTLPIATNKVGTTACREKRGRFGVSLQLRVLRLGFLQDRDVGVSIFPEGKKILIGAASFGGLVLLGVGVSQVSTTLAALARPDSVSRLLFGAIENAFHHWGKDRV